MTTRSVRRVVMAVCLAGTVGMIVASIADSTGAALTFGLLTTAAVVCLVVATAVTRSPASAAGGPLRAPDEDQARRVEALVAGLVAAGADEDQVRALVREAVRLGRSPS